MEIIDKIVSSQYPPNDRNVIWENNGKLFKIINGKWREISSGGGGSTISASVEQTNNGAIISITDNEGTTTATVDNGRTPIKGTDYWTANDKQEVIAEATAEIVNPIIFKGTLGVGGTITSLPTASDANKGWQYIVAVAGTYAGQSANVGDKFVSNGSAWTLYPDSNANLSMPQGFEVNGSVVSFAEGYSLVDSSMRNSLYPTIDCMSEYSSLTQVDRFWNRTLSPHQYSSSPNMDTIIVPIKEGDIIISNTSSISTGVGCVLLTSLLDGEVKSITANEIRNGYTITSDDIDSGAMYIAIPHRKAGSGAQLDMYVHKTYNIDDLQDDRISNVERVIEDLFQSEQTDLTHLFVSGNVVTTPDIGQPISYASYSEYGGVVIDVAVGDKITISGTGGNSYRLWAKVKNGLVVQRSLSVDTESNLDIEADDSFDQLVVNFFMHEGYPYSLIKSRKENAINKLTNDVDSLNKEIYVAYEKDYDFTNQMSSNGMATIVGESPVLRPDVAYYMCHIRIDSLMIGDVYTIKSEGGNTCTRWGKVKDGVIIEKSTKGQFSVIEETIVVDGTFDALVFNANASKEYSLRMHRVGNSTSIALLEERCDDLQSQIESLSDDEYFKGKTIAFIGDSAIAVNGTDSWANKLCSQHGAICKKFVNGGFTYLNQFDENHNHVRCLKVLIDNLENSTTSSSWTPDIIIVQAGGNDTYHYDKKGTVENAFSDFNWRKLVDSETIYDGVRFNLQRLQALYPNAILVVGTVFQNNASTRTEMADIQRAVCSRLSIPIVDSNLYSGMSKYNECPQPNYTDGASASIDYPLYNWVEPSGDIVSVTEKSSSAVKRYGRYTYDGTHKTIEAEQHIADFYFAQLKMYVK